MTNEFDEVMKQHSDAELIEVLNSEPGDYQESAMEAARREFKSRKLSADRIEQAKTEIEEQKQYERDIEKDDMPTPIIFSRRRFWGWLFSDGSAED